MNGRDGSKGEMVYNLHLITQTSIVSYYLQGPPGEVGIKGIKGNRGNQVIICYCMHAS